MFFFDVNAVENTVLAWSMISSARQWRLKLKHEVACARVNPRLPVGGNHQGTLPTWTQHHVPVSVKVGGYFAKPFRKHELFWNLFSKFFFIPQSPIAIPIVSISFPFAGNFVVHLHSIIGPVFLFHGPFCHSNIICRSHIWSASFFNNLFDILIASNESDNRSQTVKNLFPFPKKTKYGKQNVLYYSIVWLYYTKARTFSNSQASPDVSSPEVAWLHYQPS